MACAAREELPVVRNIAFRRPLIVPEDEVVVRTLALAEESDGDTVCVRVAMRSAGDDFQQNHFEAECWFGLPAPRSDSLPMCPPLAEPLDKNPEEFSPVPLFQGKFFRRITAVRQLEMEKESVTDLELPHGEVYYGDGFTQTPSTPSPALRDAFLQSATIALPPGYLPVSFGELRFHQAVESRSHCRTIIREQTKTGYLADIGIFNAAGGLVETIQDVRVQAPTHSGPTKPVSAGTLLLSLAQAVDELRTAMPQRPHALVVVNHAEVDRSQNLPELSDLEWEQLCSKNSDARLLSGLANFVAARRAAIRFVGEHRHTELTPKGRFKIRIPCIGVMLP